MDLFRKKCCEIRITVFLNLCVLYTEILIGELIHAMRKTPTFTVPKSRSFYPNQTLIYDTLNANMTLTAYIV